MRDYSKVMRDNEKKIGELNPRIQWAGIEWMRECFEKDRPFLISEAFRSQRRQNKLILIGRPTEGDFWDDVRIGRMSMTTARRGIELLKRSKGVRGRKVTWTLNSNHKTRMAADIIPLAHADYETIEFIAKKYGITHPYASPPIRDLPHFEFFDVPDKPLQLSDEASKKRILRALQRVNGRLLPPILQRAIARLNRRLHSIS